MIADMIAARAAQVLDNTSLDDLWWRGARFEELALTWQRLAANLEKAMALLDHFDPDKKSG
jgi:hypothetical protein